jgi:hypothetical protein
MPITTHKGPDPFVRARDLVPNIAREIAEAEREAHRSGAIEALTQARDALCSDCRACVRIAGEVRRLLEEYTKPTTEAP